MRGRSFLQQIVDRDAALHGPFDAIELLFVQFQQLELKDDARSPQGAPGI